MNFADCGMDESIRGEGASMHQQPMDPAIEVSRLQRCVNDLVSVFALPATWGESEATQFLDRFLDALLAMLDLNFLYARARVKLDEVPIEVLRARQHHETSLYREEVRCILDQRFGEGLQQGPKQGLRTLGGQQLSVFPIKLGVEGELGVIAAGSQRPDFPQQTESLVLGVAANQLAIGLQHALRLDEQRRMAIELDRWVAERTRGLAEINEELQLQVGMLQHLPVSAWTLKPDGTPDFVNQVWHDFSGQTLDFVRSHPEAWMTAIHPEDRETASRAFWDGVRSGADFAFETRSLRAKDGIYRWHLQQAVVLRDAEGRVLKFVGTTTDIDDQKRAEEALRSSEANLRRVIDTIPTLSWCNLPDGSNEFLSKSWHEYTGLSPEEAHGWGWYAAFHPEDLPPLMQRWQELLVSGEPGEIEARLHRYDGEYRWFLIRVAPFRDETGAILRWYGTSTDIHDRKLADEARRASEGNFRQIVDNIPGLVATLSPDGEITLVNQQFLDYFGKSLDEINRWGVNDVLHPGDLNRVEAAFTRAITTGTALIEEFRFRRADGMYRWFQTRVFPMLDPDGRIARWYALSTDIDDRKRAEEELRIRELNLLQITETIPEMLWSASPNGAIEYCNGRLLDYTGICPEQIMSDGWGKLLHPDDVEPTVEVWKSCVKSGTPYRVEVRALHAADNSYRWCVTRALPLLDREGRILKWHGTVVDMHDWKRAQEELRNTQAQLARMTRVMTIGQLTASIAHEVNQPLSGIIVNASTSLRMLKSDPPNIDGARETIQRAIRDGNRASEVISRLRTLFSRNQINVEPLDLNDAAREVIALLSDELRGNNVVMKYEFRDDLPTVNGDRVQLQQVILNLIRNGSDAMVTVNNRPRQLLIRTEAAGSQVTVSVQDSGVGLSPEISERLFDSFFTTKQEGMGIGLSVSRSIVEAHHGRLWAVGNAGPGATFAFSIPQDAEYIQQEEE
ncbi:MAG TPA: PAS domain-containing protein [Terracidiphilus sp.]|nr:PAS domain-containing protein [Terracidiphilus sp.]